MNEEKKAELEAEALEKIQDAHALLETTKVEVRDAKKDARDAMNAATAHLKSMIETGIPAGANADAVAVKLQNVELAWQNFEESKDAAKEVAKACREGLAQARTNLADAVSDSKQLNLPGV